MTEETFAYLEDTGWVYTSKHVMTYSGGLLTEFKYLDWMEETNTWQELTKQNYTYTSLKKVKSILSYEKNVLTQQWKLVSREQNEYNGLLLTKSTYDYDSGFGLQPEAKKEFTYTPTGKLKKINFFFWGFAPDWTLKYKQEYEYNAIDTLSAISNWTYNDQLPDWEGVDRTEYIYTPYHALWFEIYQDWNSATSSWVNEYRTELIYDETVDGDMILWPEAQNEENVISSFDKKLLAVTDDLYDEPSGQWIPFDTILPYYSLIVATHDVQVGSFSVFPNPASDEIVVEIGDHMNLLIEIFDNLGRRINQQPLNTSETHLQIDKESMPQGLYTWRVMHSSGQFMDAGKIIVLQN